MNTDDSRFAWNDAERELMAGIDTTRPHSARIWNHWLGGKDNYPVDREVGDRFAEIFPGISELARNTRYFLGRAVRYLAADMGVRQFLDVGTGLPTVDNTHEVAQRVDPRCRIVYVDNDPLVLAHARALLNSTVEGATTYVDADLDDPGTIVRRAASTLDFDEPIALVLMQIIGHVPRDGTDARARSIIRGLMDALPPGSYLALNESADTNEANGRATRLYNNSGAAPYHLRSPAEIVGLFEGLEPVPPGVVPIHEWRPEPDPFGARPDVGVWGGVARKP